MKRTDEDKMKHNKAASIACKIVPQYTCGCSCTGVYAKRWSAAYDAAMMAIEESK